MNDHRAYIPSLAISPLAFDYIFVELQRSVHSLYLAIQTMTTKLFNPLLGTSRRNPVAFAGQSIIMGLEQYVTLSSFLPLYLGLILSFFSSLFAVRIKGPTCAHTSCLGGHRCLRRGNRTFISCIFFASILWTYKWYARMDDPSNIALPGQRYTTRARCMLSIMRIPYLLHH
jgi:hypothetical protein